MAASSCSPFFRKPSLSHSHSEKLKPQLSGVCLKQRDHLAIWSSQPQTRSQNRLLIRGKAVDSAPNKGSILCTDCDGNGMVQCSQCKGSGVNSIDHFNGQFKAGAVCWLCRGKKEMLCGNCNGAGFLGGFMTTPDE